MPAVPVHLAPLPRRPRPKNLYLRGGYASSTIHTQSLKRGPCAINESLPLLDIPFAIASHVKEAIRLLRACMLYDIVYCCKLGKRPLETGLRLLKLAQDLPDTAL